MRMAVTGAAGFVGRHLASHLTRAGVEVLPLVRQLDARSPAGARPLEDVLREPGALSGCDALIHAAAVRHRYGTDPRVYRASNVELVGRLLQTAKGKVKRLVYVSSVGVYGFPADLPIRESHPFAPVTLYSATKVEAEALVRRMAPDLGLEWTIVRPTIVYGPGDDNGMLDKMARTIKGHRYLVVGPGDNTLHHTFVDDIAGGIVRAATDPRAAGQDFILAGPETITLEGLSELVAKTVHAKLPRAHVPLRLARAVATLIDVAAYRGLFFAEREPPINNEKLDVMTRSIAFDASKARRVLGYEPHVRYEEGVPRSISPEGGRA
jgi:nucleoside-diphosphate-sugar epimerase